MSVPASGMIQIPLRTSVKRVNHVAFDNNVFINCPYDDRYFPLLRPLLFTVMYAGLSPRLSLERMDSGEARINKLTKLIQESKYAIHDLSRIQAGRAGEYFRLNMPFELGLDVGCRVFGDGELKSKKCLILEKEPYRYQAALSDMSNSDIAVHHNDPVKVMTSVRHWLVCELEVDMPGPTGLIDSYASFHAETFLDLTTRRGFTEDDAREIPIPELMRYMSIWLKENL